MATMTRTVPTRNVGMTRTDTHGRLAIRDDGLLMPGTPKILALAGYRPYFGNPKASLDDRMAYIHGQERAFNAQVQAEQNAFDVDAATHEQLIEFALTEYGKTLDVRKPVEKLRKEVIELAAAEAASKG
jgi:hypothetical protein